MKADITIEHEGRVYTMVLDINALCQLEAMFDKDYAEIEKKLDGKNMTYLRAFVWATLRRHQPEMTLDDAGTLMTDAPKAIGQAVMKTRLSLTADPEDLHTLGVDPKKVNAKARPPQAGSRRAGSISTRVAPA